MIRSCVLLFKSCLREVSGRAKTPPCGMDIRLAVGNDKRQFLLHLNVAPSWYCQTQSSLSKGSNRSLTLWAYLKCKANNRDLRKRKGLRNNVFSFHDVFSYFCLTATYQNLFGLQVLELTCLDWEEDYLLIALMSAYHVKESCAQLHLTEKGILVIF